MQRIGKVLAAYDKRRKQKTAARASAPDAGTVLHVAARWIAAEYGRRGAACLRPEKFLRGTLVFAVADALWAQELWVRREELIAAVNAQCRARCVQRIRVRAEGV